MASDLADLMAEKSAVSWVVLWAVSWVEKSAVPMVAATESMLAVRWAAMSGVEMANCGNKGCIQSRFTACKNRSCKPDLMVGAKDASMDDSLAAKLVADLVDTKVVQ